MSTRTVTICDDCGAALPNGPADHAYLWSGTTLRLECRGYDYCYRCARKRMHDACAAFIRDSSAVPR